MLLAVDIGNTSTKFGIFRGDELLKNFSLPTHGNQAALKRRLEASIDRQISIAIACSVVPQASDALIGVLSQRQVRTTLVSNESDFGLTIRYEPRAALGTDRLVNAFAAVERHGAPAIVCSLGTATTIDVVDKDRTFIGGIIAPGLKTAARSLSTDTSLLPHIQIAKPEKLIGTSTESAIRSGVVFGHVAMIEGLIKRMSDEVGGRPQVIVTGGFAKFINSMTSIFDICDMNLTLEGLRILGERTSGPGI